ncbi:MAG TPA: DUF2058 domain-containing protein [Steroidobacteraceae bacterium]|jgi:hypothetical protein
MSMSLREQLLAAGLVSKKQAKQADQQERQHPKKRPSPGPSEEQKRAMQQAQAAKAARDQELNRQRQQNAELKARFAQIRQIIEQNRLPKIEGDDYLTFNFIDRQKVRRIAVDAARRDQIIRGELVIARSEGRYYLVPAAIGAQIRERDERSVVRIGDTEPKVEADADDPYKDHVVPDDLMW